MENLNPLKLLIIVQKLDSHDSVFGFVPDWIKELKKHVGRLYVLALFKGEHKVPGDIEVFSLGKEWCRSRIRYTVNLYRTVIPLIRRKKINGIFVFQGGPYPVLLWPLKKAFKTKLMQWKVHSVINTKAKLNLRAVDKILTAASSSFRKESSKVKILGHGINTEKFKKFNDVTQENVVLAVGRISGVKRLKEVIHTFSRLIQAEEFQGFRLEFYGLPQTKKDHAYFKMLKQTVEEKSISGRVTFKGNVDHSELPLIYSRAKVSLNMGNIGSLDKVILESMACEIPAIMRTPSIQDQLGTSRSLVYAEKDDDVLENLKRIIRMDEKEYRKLGSCLREIVIQNHSLKKLMEKIAHEFHVHQE